MTHNVDYYILFLEKKQVFFKTFSKNYFPQNFRRQPALPPEDDLSFSP